MKDLQKLTITIDRRQEYKGDEIVFSDLRIWLRMEAPDGSPGLRWISFLMIGEEGLDLFHGCSSVLADGYHQLIPFGELWTFFNTDRLHGGDAAGEASIPYRRVTVPHPVQGLILADIENAIARYDAPGNKREEIRLDYSGQLAEWSEEYGQGKGQIEVEGPADEIEVLKGEKTFDRSWDSISRLALNTTHSKTDKAPIRIHRESPKSFLWTAGRMHGGLINHGSEDAPDWSVHT